MARCFNKYPFGSFKLRAGRWYRIVEVVRDVGSGGSGGNRNIITDYFLGEDFREYEKFFPEIKRSRISYNVERQKYVPGTQHSKPTDITEI